LVLAVMWACKSRPYGAQKAPVSETPEGRSIVVLAKQGCGLRGRAVTDVDFVPFTAQTRMSSVNMPDSRQIRKVDLPAARVARWLPHVRVFAARGGTVVKPSCHAP
jgi:high-affinity K+ transport system ATPase subunit B